jgi:hypothetical protein
MTRRVQVQDTLCHNTSRSHKCTSRKIPGPPGAVGFEVLITLFLLDVSRFFDQRTRSVIIYLPFIFSHYRGGSKSNTTMDTRREQIVRKVSGGVDPEKERQVGKVEN